MSYIEYIMCDYCEETDIYASLEGVETLTGEWFEHVCESCEDRFRICEYCNRFAEEDYSVLAWCEPSSLNLCESCSEELHEENEIEDDCECYEIFPDLMPPAKVHTLSTIF